MPRDEIVSLHPADRQAIRAPIFVLGVLSAMILAVAVAQLVVPGIEGNRVHRFLVFAVAAAVPLLPYPYYLSRLRRRVVVWRGGLEFYRGRRRDYVEWGDIAEFHLSHNTANIYGMSSEAMREEFGGQRDLRLHLTTRGGAGYEIDNWYEDIESLIAAVMPEVSGRIRERAARALSDGESVRFGRLAVSRRGLSLVRVPRPWWSALWAALGSDLTQLKLAGSPHLDFDEIASARTEIDARGPQAHYRVVIRRRGTKSPWVAVPVHDIPNYAVFAELLECCGCPIEPPA